MSDRNPMPPANGAPPRVVFFDAGETLLYAHPSSAEVMAAVAAVVGVPLDPETVRAAIARLGPEVDALIEAGERFTLSMERSRRFWFWYYRRLLAVLAVPSPWHGKLAQAFYARFTDLDTWVLYDDVLGCLRDLHGRGITLGVISNWESWLQSLLHYRNIHHYFDVIAGSGDVGAEKPDPMIFRTALARGGAPAGEAVHVGDSVLNDVDGARAVGMRAILLDRDGVRTPPPGVPAVCSLAELPRVLGLT